MKNFFVCFIAVLCFSVISLPAFAASPQQPMPTWLTEAGAKPVADLELDAIQGESLLAIITIGGYITTVKVAGWAIRVALNQLAKKYGWNIRFTFFAPLYCQ